MITKADKSALTKAKNKLKKWNKKFMTMAHSPYITQQYRNAQTHYNEVVNHLKSKYRGVNLQLEI